MIRQIDVYIPRQRDVYIGDRLEQMHRQIDAR